MSQNQVIGSRAPAEWRRAVEPYVGPDARRASFQLVSTLLPLALLVWSIHLALPHSLLLALVLTVPTAGLIVRTFVLMHDCAHGSFFPSRAANDVVGFITGLITLTPFAQWRRDHALHHASSGDLDRRGYGDVTTLTVREYLAKSPRGRLAYRLLRHPAALMLFGPIYLLVTQRIASKGKGSGSRQAASVWVTNVAIVLLLVAAVLIFGWKMVLVGYALPYYVAHMAGVWLFYVQHQFEDAYWAPHSEWNYAEAAIHGSSYLRLPPVLRWFTGSIGLHHVHHVAPRIPNFRLQACHDANPMFADSPVITLRSAVTSLRLALWDEDRRRLVRFADAVPLASRQPYPNSP